MLQPHYHEIETKVNHHDQIVEMEELELKSFQNHTNTSSKNDIEKPHHAIIQLSIKENIKKYFEDEWLPTIYDKVKTYEGFYNRHVMKLDAVNGVHNYVIILIFDSLQNFKNWQTSDDRNDMVGLVRDMGAAIRHMNAYGDIINDEVGYSDYEPADVEDGVKRKSKPISRIVSHDRLTTVPRPLPPPRWKLVCLLVFGVYASLLAIGESGLLPALVRAGCPQSLIIFLNVSMVVPLLVYSVMPLIMSIPLVNSWIRAERYCPIDKMHPILRLLDQGLQMFAVKEADSAQKEIPKNILDKFHKLEVKLNRLRDVNFNLRNELREATGKSRSISISGGIGDHGTDGNVQTTTKEVETILRKAKIKSPCDETKGAADGCGMLTMAVKHFVRWEYIHDFEKWTGITSLRSIEIFVASLFLYLPCIVYL